MGGKGCRNAQEGTTYVTRAVSMNDMGFTRDLDPNQVLWFPFVSRIKSSYFSEANKGLILLTTARFSSLISLQACCSLSGFFQDFANTVPSTWSALFHSPLGSHLFFLLNPAHLSRFYEAFPLLPRHRSLSHSYALCVH